MSRSKWSPVVAVLAVMGLMFSYNIALGDSSGSAPPPDTKASDVASAAAVPQQAPCSVEQACNGELCVNRHWIIDVSAVWLAPIQTQKFGSVGIATVDHGNLDVASLGSTTDNDFTVSPRIALGVQGECWGLVFRYWRLATNELDYNYDVVSGVGTENYASFKAETLDLEVTRLLAKRENGTMLQASGGVRYAELQEGSELSLSLLDGNGNTYQNSVLANHEFSGAGFTAAIEGVRPIECTCFNLFFVLRGSLIFDPHSSDYVATRSDFVSAPSAHAFNDASADSNANLFIGELQVGGQWNRALKCVPANAFVRVAFEYQYWCTSNGGYAAAVSGTGPLGGPYGFAAGESSGNTHVNMVGLNIGTGLTW